MNGDPDTIVALSTPMGVAALGVVRLSGPLALDIGLNAFSASPTPNLMQVGYYQDVHHHIIDQCAYVYFAGPRSFTGEDVLEIYCHGNPLIIKKIIEDAQARGARMAQPGEFTKRAFENGKIDLLQAEAVAELIHAKSERALVLAGQQLKGQLSTHVKHLCDQLIHLMAQIEAYIDFPEEDLPVLQALPFISPLEAVLDQTNALLRCHERTPLLLSGIKTAIVGEPNAGKSSLLNAFLGKQRALVSPQAGTTRDYLVECITLSPYTLQLIDTAGIHDATCSLERAGIERSLEQIQQADLLIWVIDATSVVHKIPDALKSVMHEHNTLMVLNKQDLNDDPHIMHRKEFDLYKKCKISLKTGFGVDRFMQDVVDFIEMHVVTQQDDLFLVNARHAELLKNVRLYLEQALEASRMNMSFECVVSDLRLALEQLEAMMGKIDRERILDALFGQFCIGK